MDSPTYIKNATLTESVPEAINMNEAGLAGVMALAALSAALVDQVKRKIYYGKDINAEEFANMAANLSTGAKLLAFAAVTGSDINTPMEPPIPSVDVTRLNIRLLHAALGCFTESGELIEAMSAQLAGKEFDPVNFGEEIGDIEWYQAIGFDETGVTEASCREKNIAKLKKRYPEKFDADRAVNRDLIAERAALEGDDASSKAP